SLIMNGSFEQNGHTINNIASEKPMHWCSVVIPSNAFKGRVISTWASHGAFSLALETEYFNSIFAGQTAMVTQQVYIENDVQSIIFDLVLGEAGGAGWDHQRIKAAVLIDDIIVWDSSLLVLDSQGRFSGTIAVDLSQHPEFLDDEQHSLSLAIVSLVSESFPFESYYSRWDFVKFDKYCGGFGYLAGDLSQDCYVDFSDFAMLAGHWLEPNFPEKIDLYEDGEVNDIDLMLFAEDWLLNSDWTKWGQQGTYEMGLLKADFDLSGQIDLGDIGVLSEYWLSNGNCAQIELSGDNIINFKDFAVLAAQWGDKNWIYYIDRD
ncbi:MAG: dockerin type I domain-containing protein, partial [Phycisphaerae bacterium]